MTPRKIFNFVWRTKGDNAAVLPFEGWKCRSYKSSGSSNRPPIDVGHSVRSLARRCSCLAYHETAPRKRLREPTGSRCGYRSFHVHDILIAVCGNVVSDTVQRGVALPCENKLCVLLLGRVPVQGNVNPAHEDGRKLFKLRRQIATLPCARASLRKASPHIT